MKNKNLTAFQRLNQFHTGQSGDKYADDDVLWKGKDADEYELKKLELRQQSYLNYQWRVSKTQVNYQNINYEAQRYAQYMDYDIMSKYPIIGQALDIYAEEATSIDAEGYCLRVYSENPKIKKELERLFYEVLQVHTNLNMWARTMLKYGDCFLGLNWDNKLGLKGVTLFPTIHMERLEYDPTDPMRHLLQPEEVRFKLKGTSVVEMNRWQVAHFRLLMDDRRFPYGFSILDNARRIWRNIILAEDAMRTLRLLRAIDRRIFYIDIGNINSHDVQAYLDSIANRFKRKAYNDPATGQQDLKFNAMGYDQDFFIPVQGDNDRTKIETLQGSTNFSEIADIEYDLAQLFAALGVPKSFLNFAETAGEGKNLAMLDIRFARKVHRIQQAMINELNYIAVLHLCLLGYSDSDLGNFKITLTNPSIQLKVVEMELLTNKLSAYSAATTPDANGIQPMSATLAKMKILDMNEDEINLDFKRQLMERVIAKEYENASTIIKRSGLFNELYDLYGSEYDLSDGSEDDTQSQESGGEDAGGFGGGGGGGFGGGGSLGGDLGGLGGEEGATGEAAGEAADLGTGAETASAEPAAETTPPPTESTPKSETTTEAVKRLFKLLDFTGSMPKPRKK